MICFSIAITLALGCLIFIIATFTEKYPVFLLVAIFFAGLVFPFWKLALYLLRLTKKKNANAESTDPSVPVPADAHIAEQTCRKCGATLTGRYCVACGCDSLETPDSPRIEIVEEPQTTQGYASFSDFAIPTAIRDLLWFQNGAEHNLPPNTSEPSAIDTSLPIAHDSGMWSVVDLSYYPAYAQLNPEQRAVYLNWLRDIRDPVPIGYVFLFYYGLERYLFTDKYNDAVGAILALRMNHENNSFKRYSGDALALCAVARKNSSLFEQIKDDLGDTAYIWACTELYGYMTPVDLIHTYRSWGFTNTRYLRGEDGIKDLYFNALVEVVIERYGQDKIPVTDVPRNGTDFLVLANYGLPQNVREHRVPDITKSPEFAAQMQGLLTETHERVKVQLRELRKIQNTSKE